MSKYIIIGIILVAPIIILVELYIISLLIEQIADLIDTIKDKFGKGKQ